MNEMEYIFSMIDMGIEIFQKIFEMLDLINSKNQISPEEMKRIDHKIDVLHEKFKKLQK